MRAYGSLLWMLAAAAAGAEDAPRVSATVSKTEVTVGETFTVEVAAEGPPGAVFTFPAEAGNEDVVLRTPPGSGEEPSPAAGHRYQAAVFAIGDAAVPAIPVKFRLGDGSEGEVQTEPVPLRVASLLPKDPAEQKLADIRGPGPLAIGRGFWLALAAAALVVAAALALWLLRRRRPPAEARPAAAELAPDVEARRALDALAASGRVARGEYRAFYIALVDIAKRYLERRLGAPVLEMTSAETVAFLRDGPHGELLPVVRDLALAADQIKFARGHGVAAEAERHLEAVRGLVKTLESRLRPKEEKAA